MLMQRAKTTTNDPKDWNLEKRSNITGHAPGDSPGCAEVLMLQSLWTSTRCEIGCHLSLCLGWSTRLWAQCESNCPNKPEALNPPRQA
eukprot:5340735-Amphidinium_carterae.2